MKRSSFLLVLLPFFMASVLSSQPLEYTGPGQDLIDGQEYVLAGWNFNNVSNPPTSQLATSYGSGLLTTNWDPAFINTFTGSPINSVFGSPPGNDLALQNGTLPGSAGDPDSLITGTALNEGRWLEFSFSTEGFRDIFLTFALRTTGSGFQRHSWSYSLSAEGSFTTFDVLDVPGNATYSFFVIPLAGLPGIDDAEIVRVRVSLEALGGQTVTETGNNRFDNILISGFPIDGSVAAGQGSATVLNGETFSASPASLDGLPVFRPGQPNVVDINLAGQSGSSFPITDVVISPPAGWSGLSTDNVSLSGPAFASADFVVLDGQLRISGASLSEENSGFVRLSGIVAPAEVDETTLGRYNFNISTAPDGLDPLPIASLPVAYLPVPIGALKGLDEEGRLLNTGARVAVRGVSTAPDLLLSTTRFQVPIQDATGGIMLDSPNGDQFIFGYFPGEEVYALGTVSQFNGLAQISVANEFFVRVTNFSAGMPDPVTLTLAEFYENPEAYESLFIAITGLVLEEGQSWPTQSVAGTGVNLVFGSADTDATITVRITAATDIGSFGVPEPTWPQTIEGIGGQFDPTAPFTSGYQLSPRGLLDFPDVSTQSGLGIVSVLNAEPFPFDPFNDPATLTGLPVFRPGSVASLDLVFEQPIEGLDPITTIHITLPDGWSGLTVGGVSLSGDAFTILPSTTVAVSGNRLEIDNAFLAHFAPGTVSITGISIPSEVDVSTLGRYPISVSTAGPFGEPSPIAAAPIAYLPVPLGVLRMNDEQGVPVHLGERVAVRGISTTRERLLNNARFQVPIQDSTGGIMLDSPGIANFTFGYFPGEEVFAFGTVTQFNGLTQFLLESEFFVRVTDFDIGLPEPIELSLAEYFADAEAYESMFVQISNLILTQGTWPSGGIITGTGVNLTFASPGSEDTITVRITAQTDIGTQGFPEPEWPQTILGIAGQFDTTSPFTGGYQLFPRGMADFIPAEAVDGVGTAVAVNDTAGSELEGTDRYLTTESTTIRVDFAGPSQGTLSSVRVTLPEGFPNFPASFSLSGSAFAGAGGVVSGRSLTISGAVLGAGQTGSLIIPNLTLPPVVGTLTLGVETAFTGGTLTSIAGQPVLFLVDTTKTTIPQVYAAQVGTAITLDEVVIISVEDLINSTASTSFQVTDSSGRGLTIFGTNTAINTILGSGEERLGVGDTIFGLSGVRGEFNGLVQLVAPFEVAGRAFGPGAPSPVVVSAEQLLNSNPNIIQLQSLVVTLRNVTFAGVAEGANFAGGTPASNYTITDGSSNVVLRIATSRLDLVGTPIPTGPVDITGVLSTFNGYQLQPRSLADIVPAGGVPIGLFPEGYGDWIAGFLTPEQVLNLALSDPLVDLNGDGFNNWATFFFGGDPLNPAGTLPPVVSEFVNPFDGQRYLEITFPWAKVAENVSWRVEGSSDSRIWTTIASSSSFSYGSELELQMISIADTVPLGTSTPRSLRLVIDPPSSSTE